LLFCFAAAKLNKQAYPILGFAVQPASVKELFLAPGKKRKYKMNGAALQSLSEGEGPNRPAL